MRKNVFGRQFSRDTNERKALFKSLASALVMNERIHTTHMKAKTIRPYIEKLITRARMGEGASRMIEPYLTKQAVLKMMQEVAPRFAGRPGGYTRIVYTGTRIADNASVAYIEFVDKGKAVVAQKKNEAKKAVATSEKKPVVKKTAVKAKVKKEK